MSGLGSFGVPLGGHLPGPRVTALLDGRLSAAEAEEAWAHVHGCHQCRDAVEREGWVKTRLAGLGAEAAPAPDYLKGALLGVTPGEALLRPRPAPDAASQRVRRAVGLTALGGGAAGAAVMGVLALGAAPAEVPPIPTRAPAGPTPVLTTPGPRPAPAAVRRDVGPTVPFTVGSADARRP
ncbi:hypothetical protein [Nocardioides sp.]|uniref:hypothetical protein n=1 Tax=Nocardioides sp. TaxID=35761 RepID=UPI003513C085